MKVSSAPVFVDEVLTSPLPTMARVFVATAYVKKDLARAVMTEMSRRGYTVTRDWTQHSAEGLPAQALADAQAVKSADLVVAIMDLDHYEYKGTFTEVGLALGAEIHVVLISPFSKPDDAKCSKNVYFHHPHLERFKTLEDFYKTVAPPRPM